MSIIENRQIGSIWTPDIIFSFFESRSYSVESSEVRVSVRFMIRSQIVLCCFSRVISDNCRR